MRLTVLITLFLLLVAAYLLPWVVSPEVSLSPGGYDLAEWANIHPAAPGETPPLLTTLLLRLPLVCAALALCFALPLTAAGRIIGCVVALLMAGALLPPFEIAEDPGNWNYRQQAALAAFMLLFGLFAVSGVLQKARWIFSIGSAGVGAAACLIGLSRALVLFEGFRLPAHAGLGGVLTAILFVVFAGVILARTEIGQRAGLRRPIRAGQH